MKTRTGFVSNSSSSSFVVIVTPDAFEAALGKIDKEVYRKVLRGVSTKTKVLGQNAIVIQDMTDNGGLSSLFGEGDDLDYIEMGITGNELEELSEEDESLSSSIYELESVLTTLKKTKEYKDKIFIADDCGNG